MAHDRINVRGVYVQLSVQLWHKSAEKRMFEADMMQCSLLYSQMSD